MFIAIGMGYSEKIFKKEPFKLQFTVLIVIWEVTNVRMEIRKYQPSDCKTLTELFYHTVHTVNAKDYTEEQLNVWATKQMDLEKWNATAICDQLEQAVEGSITTHASITAKPFFEKRGYQVAKEQQVERQGIFLTNYVMIKE